MAIFAKKTISVLVVFSLLILNTQCKKNESAGSVQFTEKTPPPDALFLSIKPADSGVDFENHLIESFENNVAINAYLYSGGGVGILDVNNDGLQDIFFVSTQQSCQLYLNQGGLKFKNITETAGVAVQGGDKTGVTIVDINLDGWQDIYVCRTGINPGEQRRNVLLINNQNGTFTNKAKEYGLDDASASNHANFFDADGDGDLDCYVLNYPVDFAKVNSVRAKRVSENSTEVVRITEPNNYAESDHLYINNGNNTFSDASQASGIWNRAMGLSATISDFNNDGLMDILVANDYIEPDFVYINNPSKPGTFTDHYNDLFRHSSSNSMGTDIGDLNNDGWYDIIALDMLAEDHEHKHRLMNPMVFDRYNTLVKYGYGHQEMRNVLQANNGNGTYSEVACLSGVAQTDWSWSPLIQDYNNDGLRDLFISNGYRRDVTDLDYQNYTSDSIQRTGGVSKNRFPDINEFLNLIPSVPLQSYCFSNQGDFNFKDVSTDWGFTQLGFSNGAVYADLDNDGDMDIITNNIDRPASIYQNRAVDMGKSGGWLQLKLKGSTQNPAAIGTKVRVEAGGQVQYSELTPNRGFLSSVEQLLQFGLGTAGKIDRLEVEFPGKKLVVKEQINPNQRITIDYAEAKPGRLTPPASGTALVVAASAPDFTHKEDDSQDFTKQWLIPWETGDVGPFMAVADVNKDGLDDCFIGNGPGAPGGMYLQSGSGFRSSSAATFAADAASEDAACQFFDADGDGDQDLVVASGGTSFPANSNNYPTRLYLNDGKGNFTKAANAIPIVKDNINSVSTQDYDRDGDLDLFLGGGYMAGSYPATPPSFVLQNNKGVFTDVTAQVAPDFAKIGMVHSIIWADLDGNQRPEMIVAGEWMPIQVFSNNGGKLELSTSKFGLENTNGFWNSLAVADLDKDGDMDIIAGNLGLNSLHKASQEAPLKMFAKDFDVNGSMDPIMTLTYNGKDVPIVTRELMVKQLPIMKKKYLRYANYAKADINDMFAEKDLKDAKVLQCNLLASTVFINQNGKFTPKALPNSAQTAPVNGIIPVDIDNDGDIDLITAGNDYGMHVEIGPLDAGNGAILINDGAGNFTAVPPYKSGFWATREVRDIKLLKSAGNKRLILVANNNDKLQAFSIK